MYRALSALATALLLAGAATACTEERPDPKPTKKTAAPKKAQAKKNLADTYTDKLNAVSEGSTAHCASPSSIACSDDIGAIMTVVQDLQKDIDANGGASAYPKSTQQVAKMRAAQQEYEDNNCEGDPSADDPNSDCWGTMAITVGTTTLGMALTTDELS
ncbi:hypothetical protein ACWEG1_29850 [Streptomyces bauhiniae]